MQSIRKLQFKIQIIKIQIRVSSATKKKHIFIAEPTNLTILIKYKLLYLMIKY